MKFFGMEIPPQNDDVNQESAEKAELFDSHSEKVENTSQRKTPLRLRLALEAQIRLLSKNFEIIGEENLAVIRDILEKEPDAKFIIAPSHFSDLDVSAAGKAFGNDLDLQITTESLLPEQHKIIPGKENFTSLDFKEDDNSKRGVFNPENFIAIKEKMNEGKTPWFAIHEFSRETQMEQAKIGAVYLAELTNAYVIPSALEIKGKNFKLDENGSALGQLKNRLDLSYHIGKPFRLEKFDVSPIASILKKRERGEKLEPGELALAREVHKKLKQQAERVAFSVSAMLPEEQRGEYL